MRASKNWINKLIHWADKNQIPELQWIEGDEFEEGFWIGFPREPEALIGLNELDLSWHDLDELPEELGYLTQLEVLNIDKSRDGLQPDWQPKTDKTISSIPSWVFKLTNLKVLGLEGNSIEEIPEGIKNLKKLETLWLPRNRIENLPKGLFEITNLKNLSFSCNRIAFVPDELASFHNLERLSLWNNSLTEFPQSILSLENLKILELINNDFIQFPSNIFQLGRLKHFDMAENLSNSPEGKILQ